METTPIDLGKLSNGYTQRDKVIIETEAARKIGQKVTWRIFYTDYEGVFRDTPLTPDRITIDDHGRRILVAHGDLVEDGKLCELYLFYLDGEDEEPAPVALYDMRKVREINALFSEPGWPDLFQRILW